MQHTATHIVTILIVTTIVFFLNLGQASLWDRDEPRNAGCAAEMLARGDAVVPIFNGQLRHQKPALLYWLMMSAYSVMGVNEFSARFWSALLAVGTSLATYVIGRRLYDPQTGWLAAIALSTSLMFVLAARAATPDSVLIFCSTTSLMLYVLGVFPKRTRSPAFDNAAGPVRRGVAQPNDAPSGMRFGFFPEDWRIVVGMYAMMGLGVLAKGPIGFLLPMAMIGLFGLIHTRQRESKLEPNVDLLTRVRRGIATLWAILNPLHFLRTLWRMQPLLAAGLILLIAAPWFVLVHLKTEGDFSRLFFVGEHFGRATQAMENHSGGWWFYPVAILLGFFPWSCFWGPTLVGVVVAPSKQLGQHRTQWLAANTFLLAWVGVQVGAFSLAQTKLPSYVTPCYPALSILTAHCLLTFIRQLSESRSGERWSDGPMVARGWFFAAAGGLLFSGLLIGAGLWFGLGEYLPQQRWLASLGLIPVAGGMLMLGLLWRGHEAAIAPTFALASFAFSIALFGFGATEVSRMQQSQIVFDSVRELEGARIATYGCLESSWVFYGRKPITELIVGEPSEATIRAKLVPRKFWKPIPRETLEAFVSLDPVPGFVVTTDEYLAAVQRRLPRHYRVIKSTPYFLRGQTIYLLGPDVDQVAQQADADKPRSVQR